MPHEQLWAPWRLHYIQGGDRPRQADPQSLRFLPGADPACFLCRGLADSADRENLVVYRGQWTTAFLNRYPYNNGHLLIAPLAHKGRLDELTDHEHLEMQQLMARFVTLFDRLIKAEGFNAGLNLGRAAGAGLPGHLHWHLVPRWNGDTNFMSVMGGVDVIPQSLDAMWSLLREALASGEGVK